MHMAYGGGCVDADPDVIALILIIPIFASASASGPKLKVPYQFATVSLTEYRLYAGRDGDGDGFKENAK